jgi:hypothetical protein
MAYFNFTDASKLERFQHKFLGLCYNCSCPQIRHSYANASEYLMSYTSFPRRRLLKALRRVNFYNE